jgi:signal transduction histidine kinase
MLVTIDVTDSLNYQKQIEEQNRDLSDFTSMVSHDLKAPIFTIKGMAAALLEDLSPRLKEEERQQLQYILDGGTRLEQLISSVLAYSKLSASPPPEGEVPLREVLKSVLNDLAGQIEAADARVVVPPTLPVLRGDALGFYQIFSNLIANSLKYASPTRKPVISIASFITEGGTVELTVSDNGIGIPNTKIDEVFRPFKRGNHLTIDGSGIGLACVKKLTERFGGTVRATSNEGDGTTMHLLFPLPHPGALAHLDPQRDAEKDRAQEQPVEL